MLGGKEEEKKKRQNERKLQQAQSGIFHFQALQARKGERGKMVSAPVAASISSITSVLLSQLCTCSGEAALN